VTDVRQHRSGTAAASVVVARNEAAIGDGQAVPNTVETVDAGCHGTQYADPSTAGSFPQQQEGKALRVELCLFGN